MLGINSGAREVGGAMGANTPCFFTHGGEHYISPPWFSLEKHKISQISLFMASNIAKLGCFWLQFLKISWGEPLDPPSPRRQETSDPLPAKQFRRPWYGVLLYGRATGKVSGMPQNGNEQMCILACMSVHSVNMLQHMHICVKVFARLWDLSVILQTS